ncbi:MAG: hypothetical protein E7354_05185 [Clostridiales bacterium]|nr:hypothetical protein [Clostridiales bacterium]
MATKKTTLSPAQVKEKMLKAYMRRQVSGMGTLLNQRAFACGIDSRDMYNALNENFANPKGYSREHSVLGPIDDDIRTKHKSAAVYNYFDLDTLIAYGRYLQKALESVNAVASGLPRGRMSANDFFKAIDSASSWMVKHKRSMETGGYNPDRPVRYLRDADGKLAPESTISMQDFDKKYDEAVCESALEEYMEFGLEHGRLIDFGGKKYELSAESHYRTYPDDYSVRYIRAGRRDGMIHGYIDQEDKPYFGEVYDLQDDQFVYYDTADGIEVFDRENTSKVKSFGKLYRKSPAQTYTRYSSQGRNRGKGGM